MLRGRLEGVYARPSTVFPCSRPPPGPIARENNEVEEEWGEWRLSEGFIGGGVVVGGVGEGGALDESVMSRRGDSGGR